MIFFLREIKFSLSENAVVFTTIYFALQILLLFSLFATTIHNFVKAKYKDVFCRENIPEICLLLLNLFCFLESWNVFYPANNLLFTDFALILSLAIIILRFLKKNFSKQKISSFWDFFVNKPAKTILFSFLLILVLGTILLTMSFATVDHKGLSLINAFFTSTSAVCVTGLIVVDTATTFTFWGKLIIMLLIQIGGLGIMILSFFTVYLFKRRVSLSNKLLLSYLLSDDDMTNIQTSLTSIVVFTFVIEAIGAIILFVGFLPIAESWGQAVFWGLFHSISAFCNGGFSLFSDSLESLRNNYLITGTISVLIITGGISFSVLVNLKAYFLSRHPSKNKLKQIPLSVNSKIVLVGTGILLILGTLLVYFFEHGNSMANYSIGEQYWSAFFQSVTLRTAGFNSISFSSLKDSTYFVMIIFMFIGTASGSTGGGIKINTTAVLGATIKSYSKGEHTVRLSNHTISQDRVIHAYLILGSCLSAGIFGTILLSITENASFISIIFEVFSALSTSGVSAGITSALSSFGKIIIIMLMFWGRTGALTILSVGKKTNTANISLPNAEISIG